MIQLMRKHGKWFFALLGVALMFMWLNPRQGRDKTDNSGDVRGTLHGKKVTNADLDRATRDVIVLTALTNPRSGLPITTYWSIEDIYNFYASLYPNNRELHFYLLLKEAQQYGINAGMDEVQTVVARLNLPPEDLKKFLETLPVTMQSPDQLQYALQDYLIISKYENFIAGSLQPSIPQVRHLAADIGSKLSFRYITLDAMEPAIDVMQPSPEDIEKQFKTYRNVLPETAATNPPVIDGHTYPFAYMYPDRVKVEFLTFNRDAIRRYLAANPDRTAVEDAYRYYQAHLSEFKTTDASQPSTARGFMDPPASAPAATARIRSFDEVQEQITNALLDDRTNKVLTKMADAAEKLATDPWNKVSVGSDGYHDKPPEGFTLPSYQAIAQQIQKQFNYLPDYTAPKGWMNSMQLSAELGIGRADFRNSQGQRLADFASLALHVKEIAGAKRFAGKSMQVGVDGPTLRDEANNRYIFRVIEAEAAHEPKSLDDVRDQVVLDLRRVARYKTYVALGAQLATEAAKTDLRATGDARKLPVRITEPFARLSPVPSKNQPDTPSGRFEPTAIIGLGAIPQLSNAAFKLAVERVPTGTGSTPATTPASAPATAAAGTSPASAPATAAASQPAPLQVHATTSVAIDAKLKVFVVEIATYEPLPISIYETTQFRQGLGGVAMRQEALVAARKWFGLEDIAARMDFVPVVPFSRETE